MLAVTEPHERTGPPGMYRLFAIETRTSDETLAPSAASFVDVQ
jgi:hypothetical protein